jgi:hypothetical protein
LGFEVLGFREGDVSKLRSSITERPANSPRPKPSPNPKPNTPLYSTCLFCNQPLGANEVVEAFPVGRRLAFDQQRGRLWVVCRKCAKWNLTPLEERWEAIESCERLFRDSRKRFSTDNIGLAKLTEGLELIRIGEPMRPEFAAWRYGDQFNRRYRRWIAGLAGGSVISGGLFSAGLGGAFVASATLTLWLIVQSGHDFVRGRRVIARLPGSSGQQHTLRVVDAYRSRLVPGERREDWSLQLRLGFMNREVLMTGDEARRVAGRIVPHINRQGGTKREIGQAVRDVEDCGGPDRYLSWAARNTPNMWGSQTQWLGVEIAINEENERHALETELHHLEMAWKDAEELAAIADRLTIPKEVEQLFSSLRGKSTRGDR